MVVECPDCNAIVDGVRMGAYNCSVEDTFLQYQLLRCPRCSRPFVAVVEELGPYEFGPAQQVFPALTHPVSRAVPQDIASTFEEARACMRARAHTAAAIMCRKALEGVCVQHGVAERNLKRSLEALRDSQVIDGRLFEWADALRMFGNEAAHDVQTNISKQDADDIIAFTNALLEYVFTFRDRFEEFRKRRLASQTTA